MKYRVVFRSRSTETGDAADSPASFVDTQLDEETVVSATFVERFEPDGLHSSDVMDEDAHF